MMMIIRITTNDFYPKSLRKNLPTAKARTLPSHKPPKTDRVPTTEPHTTPYICAKRTPAPIMMGNVGSMNICRKAVRSPSNTADQSPSSLHHSKTYCKKLATALCCQMPSKKRVATTMPRNHGRDFEWPVSSSFCLVSSSSPSSLILLGRPSSALPGSSGNVLARVVLEQPLLSKNAKPITRKNHKQAHAREQT